MKAWSQTYPEYLNMADICPDVKACLQVQGGEQLPYNGSGLSASIRASVYDVMRLPRSASFNIRSCPHPF